MRQLILLSVMCACGGQTSVVESPASLPVERVVLFQNGMAYIERRGEIDEQSFDLHASPEGIHDVLKSLSVVDHEGGAVTGVRVLEDGETARLRIGLSSDGSDDVSVAYVAEASGWRPTYRVVDVGDDRVRLQGLAVVDNPSGEDWEGVRLALSTEVPLAFRYEVGTARVAQRPTLDSNGRLQIVQPIVPVAPTGNVQTAYGLANAVSEEASQRAGRRVNDRNARINDNIVNSATPAPQPAPVSQTTNAMSAIDARDPAEGFTLETPERLTLGAGESGLVPFVDTSTPGRRVLLYKPAPVTNGRPGASHTHPYQAVMFVNPLQQPLLTGPVTVYAEGSFQGDGVTAAIPADAHAFVAYAINPSVRIDAHRHQAEDEIRGLSVTGGVLTVRMRRVVEHRFGVSGNHDSLVYAFVGKEASYTPEGLPGDAIVTGAGYFVPLRDDSQTVRLVQPTTTQVDLSADPHHMYVPALLDLIAARDIDVQPLRDIVNRLDAIGHERTQHQRDLDVRERALTQQREALGALRDVPGNAALRRRLGQSVAQGVRAVDESTRSIVALEAERVALRQDWYARLRALDL